MVEFWNLVVGGAVAGGLYAILASGIVLTYQTSGIFNFAHGAIAFATAFLFFQLNTGLGWPVWLAAIVAIVVFAPLLVGARSRGVPAAGQRPGHGEAGGADRPAGTSPRCACTWSTGSTPGSTPSCCARTRSWPSGAWGRCPSAWRGRRADRLEPDRGVRGRPGRRRGPVARAAPHPPRAANGRSSTGVTWPRPEGSARIGPRACRG